MFQNKTYLKRRPLLVAFLLFGIGIIFAEKISVPFSAVLVLIFVFSALLCLALFKGGTPFFILSGLLIFILGIASYINFNTLPKDHISYLLKPDIKGTQYYIRGRIKSEPIYKWQRWSKRRCGFTFQAMAFKQGNAWLKLSGLSKAEIDDNELDYHYGDDIVVFATLKGPVNFSNKSNFDYVKYLKTKGVHVLIDIKNDDDIVALKNNARFSIRAPIYNIRRIIEKRLKFYLPYPDNTLISAMLLASRHSMPKRLRELFVKTGSVHVLSVSGLHVAIISAIIFFILKVCCLSRKISAIIVILFLAIYVIIAQERAPILRASIMITIYLLSYIIERDFDIYTALALSGIIILLINPMQIFTAGFVLSFACVFSLVYLTPKLDAIFTRRKKEKVTPNLSGHLSRFAQYIKRLLSASSAVFIGVWPITAIYFNIISPISIAANIFIVPLLGVIICLGIMLASVPILLKPVAVTIAYILHLLLVAVLRVLAALGSVPFSYFYISGISLYVIILYYMLVYIVVRLFLDRNMVYK